MRTLLKSSVAALFLLIPSPNLHAQGTAFTYQGQLEAGGNPANGSYDLQFTLYDAATSGSAVGSTTNTGTAVNEGLFMATLDFGGVFDGSGYWLEIAVRTNGGGAFTTLSPRQPITAAPQALYAANAGSAATATSASVATSVSGSGAGLAANTVPLSALAQGGATVGQPLVWNGSAYAPGNPLTYTSVGSYFAYPSNGIGSSVYIVAGAAGTYANSAGTLVDFAGANGTYTWLGPNSVGASWGPAVGETNTGVFYNGNGWFLGFTFSGVTNDYYGSWTIYTTNTYGGQPGWIPYASSATHNAVLYATQNSIWLAEMRTPAWWSYQPSGTPSAVTVTPPMTNVATVVTVPRLNPLECLLNFPSIGPSKSFVTCPYNNYAGMQTNVYTGMLSLTSGAGVIREIECQNWAFGYGNGQTNITLQIFPDCGNTAGGLIPSSNYMTFCVPISILSSTTFMPGSPGAVTNWSKNYDTRYIAVSESWTNNLYRLSPPAILPDIELVLKLTCPFTNGIYVTCKWGNGEQISVGEVHYSLDPSGQLNYPFSNWRLRSYFTSNYGGAGYGNIQLYGPTAWGSIIPTLIQASGPGAIIGLWGAIDESANGSPTECTFQFYCDGQLVPWQPGGEDTFLNPWEEANGGNIQQWDWGTPNFSPGPGPGSWLEFYRQWGPNNACFWNTSIYGVLPNHIRTMPYRADFCVLYYGP
jgi:hypothetical protein